LYFGATDAGPPVPQAAKMMAAEALSPSSRLEIDKVLLLLLEIRPSTETPVVRRRIR
jgi:hypothetical protein